MSESSKCYNLRPSKMVDYKENDEIDKRVCEQYESERILRKDKMSVYGRATKKVKKATKKVVKQLEIDGVVDNDIVDVVDDVVDNDVVDIVDNVVDKMDIVESYIFVDANTLKCDINDLLIKIKREKLKHSFIIKYIELSIISLEKNLNLFSCKQLKVYLDSIIKYKDDKILMEYKNRICVYENGEEFEEIDKEVKTYVFDLDNTLYMHNVNEEYFLEYKLKLIKFLRELKENGIILCIATHNKNPVNYLNELNIKDLFEHIIYEQRDVCSYLNKITDYTPKSEMIKEIMELTNCNSNEVIFFDDDMYNIRDVESKNIKSILVCDKIGITFDNIKCRKLTNNLIKIE